ncbi:TM2 domain-containing protein [Campylobacter majalis]|uniref:TM2 domain-containing protein n=1 Tax=Campylobacter majalis TaxID=2790656 RepID=UPI003D694415
MDKIDYFPKNSLFLLKDSLEKISKSQENQIYLTDFKNPTICLILSIVLGFFGADRYYIGDTLIFVIKLILGLVCVSLSDVTADYDVLIGLYAIFFVVDIFLVHFRVKEQNLKKLELVLAKF